MSWSRRCGIKRKLLKRDVAGFLAHMVQETGENNSWILANRKQFNLSWEEALECYMKGALWTWFEGAAAGETHKFECGDHPECGNWAPQVEYCDPGKKTYDMDCSKRTSGGKVITYAGRGAIQLSWNYNYGMFAK